MWWCWTACSLVLAVLPAPGVWASPTRMVGSTTREADEIVVLPGWTGPLPSRQYSGYLPSNVGKTHFMHYWFIESESRPLEDPLIVWYNGGPGGSSMYGMLVELGPLLLTGDSVSPNNPSAVPKLFYNNNSWSKNFNLLVADFPPPVGFSYCTEAAGCPVWNDTSAAQENYQFLLSFFANFPALAHLDVFLTGESYAGVYVPELVKNILANPGPIRLKGIALGDVCLGTESFGGCASVDWAYWNVEFMRGHQQYSQILYQNIIDICGTVNLRNGNFSGVPGCQDLLKEMERQIGGYNRLSLYDECYLFQPSRPSRLGGRWAGGLNDYPCGGEYAMGIWVNNSEVRHALHVLPDKFFFQAGNNWEGYNMSEKDLKSWYQEVLSRDELRVTIYNGDTDPAVQSDGVESWAQSLGLPVQEAWRPWTYGDDYQLMGGFVTTYEHNFAYVTFRGSGHMVPWYRPQAALELITRFVRNEELDHYHGPYPAPQHDWLAQQKAQLGQSDPNVRERELMAEISTLREELAQCQGRAIYPEV